MYKLLLIALAGAMGSVTRYALSSLIQRRADVDWPVGTFCVNLAGCFIAGIVAGVLVDRLTMREEFRLAIGVGFLGGFTTFSALGVETFNLLRGGQTVTAIAYATASVVAGVAAVAVGFKLAV